MNWFMFFFVLGIGTTAGLIVRGGQMSQWEAWSLVMGRIGLAFFLALSVPAGISPAVAFAFGVSEVGRVFEYLIGRAGNWVRVSLEARKWLPR